MPPPRIVCTIGMHGSASTWLFNAAREILNASLGEAAVLPFFADKMVHFPDVSELSGKTLVIKSHEGSPEFEDWLDANHALRLLSIRDPRDATISQMQRFRAGLQAAANGIARDGIRLQRLAARGIRVWRYEDGFFENEATLDELAALLSCPLSTALRAEIFARYETEAVRDFAANLASLPPERLTMVGPFAMDKVTQILTPHIGDGASGKHRALPPDLQPQLTKFFGSLLMQFGYPA